MNTWLVILGIVGGLWLLSRLFQDKPAPPRIPPQVPPSPPPPTKSGDVYRPRSSRGTKPRIEFQTPGAAAGATRPLPSEQSLEGLHDAFTGAPLDRALGLHQCTNCKVYYHSASLEVLNQENASRCVACGSASIVSLTAQKSSSTRGRDFTPDLVTLSNFRSHFDRVVTFEGRVHAVRVSRRGSDYAVMFENASWVRGLKLVFFRGAVRDVGGPDFIKSLEGRTVRVRGLLINDSKFGPEIIISERGMILRIS